MVNIRTTGAREASTWFEAPGRDFVTWSGLHDAALAAGQRGRG